MPDKDSREVDHYQRFLDQRRYEHAITRPWLLMTAAGATLLMLLLHEIFSSPLRVTEAQFLNPYFGGLAVATAVAIYGLSIQSTQRWPAILILTGLMPLALGLLDVAERGRLITDTNDWVFLIAYVTKILTAGYVLVRRDPVPPPTTTGEA